MTAYAFGTGTLIARQPNLVEAPPFMFGLLQDVSLDFDQTFESVVGQNKIAVALGDGELKITGKAKFARLRMPLNPFAGQTSASGMEKMVGAAEATSIPAASPYVYVVANASLTPLEDCSVFYQSNGIQLVPVASSPSVGQYAFDAATGTYIFAEGDAWAPVYVYYASGAPSGRRQGLPNPLMGTAPIFEVYFKTATTNFGVAKEVTIKLNACKSSKLSLGFANQKFVIPDLDFQAMADASGNVFTLSMEE
jgi:hypothetical protein